RGARLRRPGTRSLHSLATAAGGRCVNPRLERGRTRVEFLSSLTACPRIFADLSQRRFPAPLPCRAARAGPMETPPHLPGLRPWLGGSTLLFCCALMLFAVVGFPSWLSAVTLMSKVPPNRSMVALGVANALLLCAATASPQTKKPADVVLLVIIGGWGVFLLIMARSVAENVKSLAFWELVLSAAALTILAYGLLQERFKEGSIFAIAVISIGATCWFNPLVRGGSVFLYRNSLAVRMRALSARDQKARWVTFGTMFYADYPRLLGLPALNGTHPYPQFAF